MLALSMLYRGALHAWTLCPLQQRFSGLQGKGSNVIFQPCCAQIGQLYKIFRVLGTPDASVWPGIEELPDWQPGFPKWQRQDLTQVRCRSVCTARG